DVVVVRVLGAHRTIIPHARRTDRTGPGRGPPRPRTDRGRGGVRLVSALDRGAELRTEVGVDLTPVPEEALTDLGDRDAAALAGEGRDEARLGLGVEDV